MDRAAWLIAYITSSGMTRYLEITDDGIEVWTCDAQDALQFARRIDARRYLARGAREDVRDYEVVQR